LIRTLDPAPFITIANHPEVRPWLGFEDVEMDIGPAIAARVAHPDNFALLTKEHDGGYLYLKLQAGLYAVHTLAAPSARGRPMLRLMREGLAFMFSATDCVEIITQIPDGNENAKAWSQLAGFRDTFRRESFFPLMGETVGCQFRSLGYQDWALSHAPNATLGNAFHEVLHSHGLASHAEDKAHDSMVGATILAAQGNNVIKGAGLYSRWAVAAGYASINVLSVTPTVIDTGDAVVTLLNGSLEVLHVKQPARSAILDS